MASQSSSSDQQHLNDRVDDDDDDDDVLYGDLSDTKPAAAVSKAPPSSSSNKKRRSLDLDDEESALAKDEANQALQKRIEDLTEENRHLRRNIGTLYRTAKAEIKRKDDEISRLVQELESLKK